MWWKASAMWVRRSRLGRGSGMRLCYAPNANDSEFALQLVEEQQQAGPAMLCRFCRSVPDAWQIRKIHRVCWRWCASRSWGWQDLHQKRIPGWWRWSRRRIRAISALSCAPSTRSAPAGCCCWKTASIPTIRRVRARQHGGVVLAPGGRSLVRRVSLPGPPAGYHVYGTSAHAQARLPRSVRYQLPCILLLGSEREGLSQAQTAACERLSACRCVAGCTSLNLAVAAGVMLYAMLRQET